MRRRKCERGIEERKKRRLRDERLENEGNEGEWRGTGGRHNRGYFRNNERSTRKNGKPQGKLTKG